MADVPFPDSLPPGTPLLDEYRIERALGGDGFATAYVAREPGLDRSVLITEYLPRAWAARAADGTAGPRSVGLSAAYAEGLKRFLAGARILANVDHSRIAKVHRVAEANGTAYLVTEHARGRSLEEELEAVGPLPDDRVRKMLEGLAAGLAEVHALGLLHLDIRPGNVMVRSRDGAAVLVGFGSAASQVGAATESLWTAPATAYAPIEQYSPTAERGPWSDIYALGAVGYTALTGRQPVYAAERARRDTLPDPAAATGRSVNTALACAVESAMRMDETARPPDLASWLDMLSGESAGQSAPAVGRGRKRATPAVRINRRRMFYAAGITVVALGAAAMVSVARNSSLTSEQRAAAAEARLGLGPETIGLVEMGLSAEGHYTGEPDGVLDPDARGGLRRWQVSRGIEETGYLDRESLSELFAAGRAVEEEAEEARLEAEREAEAHRLAEERRQDQEEQIARARRRAEEQRLEFERQLEAQRLEAERIKAERLEAGSLESERLEAERLEAERREAERIEAERLEAERLEEERLAEEARLAEEERLAEADRLAEEARLEAERQAEADRLAEARLRFALAQGEDEVLLVAATELAGTTGSLNWSRDRNRVLWTGVQLEGDAVTGIDLAGRGLAGELPEALGLLRDLQYLSLADNRISGRIPGELGALGNLEVLYLQGNLLSGEIPAELGSLSRLEDLYLDDNPLTGSIPAELGDLGNLRRMVLSRTRVAGRIPPALGRLERLEVLALERNQLSGSIPVELGNLGNLKRLSLSHNRLSGCIPEGLSRFESNINPQLDGVNLPRCVGQAPPARGR